MAGGTISRELFLFGTAALLGAFLCLLYDLLRSCRNVLPPGKRLLGVTDFAYWIFCGCFLFYLVLRSGQGNLRGYQLLGIFLGGIVWKRSFSRTTVRICSYILSYPVFFINFLRKRLFFFLRRCRILRYHIFRRGLKGKRTRLKKKMFKRGKGSENNK